jgi:deoxyribonuclease V
MIVCLDVDYRPGAVVAACVGFTRWTDAVARLERAATVADTPAPYVPGQFYLRELPALLAILARARVKPAIVVVDGYVTLAPGRAGLGEHLHRALGGVPVVGVAKTEFHGATHAVRVLRGTSRKPLLVTSAGIPVREAADAIRSMHGPHRIPTLIRRADALSRA